ncbi:MAG: hypothetical protein IPO09_19110 [Anaeromyxobacter sp.]|nr:hypothetical protein [Anaeromyxobacter sp.]
MRDAIENWPALRHEVVIDFTKWIDGRATRKGRVVWLVNTMKMLDGRKANSSTRLGNDPATRPPVMKIIIGDDDHPDASIMPRGRSAAAAMPSRPADLASPTAPHLRPGARRHRQRIRWLISSPPLRADRSAGGGEA